MAAILCKTIGELCDSFGKVLCLPCKALGFGCDVISEVIKSPFFPYLATTFALNVPPVVYAINSFNANCPDLAQWILINGGLCLGHLIASIYIVRKIQESHDDVINDPNDSSQINDAEKGGNYYHLNNFSMPKENEYGARNSCARIKYVLCYDKAMAIYIIVAVFWACWQCVGVSKWVENGINGDYNEDCYEVARYIGISISLGYAYMCMVFCAFLCSLCCLR